MATSSRWHWGRLTAGFQGRNGTYRVIFRHRGKQYFVAIGKVSLREAEAKCAQVDYLLLRLGQRLIDLPPGADIVDFVRFDGEPPATGGGDVANPVAKTLTLGSLRDCFIEARKGGREASTQYTIGIHVKHLVANASPRPS